MDESNQLLTELSFMLYDGWKVEAWFEQSSGPRAEYVIIKVEDFDGGWAIAGRGETLVDAIKDAVSKGHGTCSIGT